jgi:tripartite-type tricarboxylate transporter receptor subunit TctC
MIRWLRYLLATTLCALSVNAFAQAWPSRPITWIVPYPAGGVTDATSRAVAKRASEILGTPVSVENKAGAAGMIGTEQGVRAAPDGYTVMYISPGPVVTNPHLYKTMRYDPLKDMTFVHGMFASPAVLVVPASSPFKTLAELVDFARRNPDKLNFGSSGSGTAPHIGMEIFRLNAGIQMTHVPYKGSAPALTDLIGGRLDLVLDYPTSVMPHIQSGRVRALAVMSDKRFGFLPDVPSIVEAGYPNAAAIAWTGVAVPAGTPAPIVSKLSAAIRDALADPAVVGPFEKLGAVVLTGMSEDKFRAFILEDYARQGDAVRRAGITLD